MSGLTTISAPIATSATIAAFDPSATTLAVTGIATTTYLILAGGLMLAGTLLRMIAKKSNI